MPRKNTFAKVTNQIGQVKGIVENAKTNTVKLLGPELKKHSKVVSDLFYAQKALMKGASKELPFITLVALGEKLNHPAYKKMVSEVIESNMLKYKGEYLKLDDPYQQAKIRKALYTYQFEVCRELYQDGAA